MIVLSVVQSSAPTRIHNAIFVTDTSTILDTRIREIPCLTIISSNVFMDIIFIFSFDTDNCCKISLAFSNFRTYKSVTVYTSYHLHRCRCRYQRFPRRVCLHRKTTYVNILSIVLTECFLGICDMTAELPCRYICTGHTATREERLNSQWE